MTAKIVKRALVGLLAAAAVATGAAVVLNMGGRGETAAASPPPTATAEIVRGDLTDTVSLPGKITFSGERAVRGRSSGIITAVTPRAGRSVRAGCSTAWTAGPS